ncbi:unnamed protein product [Orchesella dallaii]|uniref:Uncharacterized protein n=1 Tax=Orchesella dallaii TaxID=48710 RepID=A0ABP1Q8K9_9HEXA
MANRRQPESYRVAPREGNHRGKSENSSSSHSTYPRTNTVTEQINTLFSQAVDKMAGAMFHITGRLDQLEFKQATALEVQNQFRKEMDDLQLRSTKTLAEVEQLKTNFKVPEKPSDKLKCEGNSENRTNDQFTDKIVSQKETDKVIQINVIPEEVCKRKNTMPMSLAKVFPCQEKSVSVKGTQPLPNPCHQKEDKIKLDTKKKQAEEENNKRLAEIISKNTSIQKQKVDLEQDLFISDTEAVSEDDSMLSVDELRAQLANAHKQIRQLAALQPREPVERGSRPRPNKHITQGKRKRKIEATKKTGITDEELSD